MFLGCFICFITRDREPGSIADMLLGGEPNTGTTERSFNFANRTGEQCLHKRFESAMYVLR
jgi:hypothetical protein